MSIRPIACNVAIVALLLLPIKALAATYDFEDMSMAIHYTDAPAVGPGLFPTTFQPNFVIGGGLPTGPILGGGGSTPPVSTWGSFLDNGSVTNNGVTLTLSGFPMYAFPDYMINGPDPYNGTPAFLLSQALESQGPAKFSLSGIPKAPTGYTYDLVLYGTDFSGDSGSLFSLTQGSGRANKGIDATVNSASLGVPNDSFAEGVNYVLYNNVVPYNGMVGGLIQPLPVLDPPGSIATNPVSDNAYFNGLQLVTVPLPVAVPSFEVVATPEPTSASLMAIGLAALLRRRRSA